MNARRQRIASPRLPLVAARRAALTLLEIVLALAIFFGSIAVLSQLAWNGTRAAVQARLKTQALVLCEAKLAEVLVGATPMQPQSNVPYPDDPTWTWSLAEADTKFPELRAIEITVSHKGGNSLGNVTQSLRRWVRDPALFLAAAQAAAAEQSSTSSSTSTSGSTSSSGGGQ